MVFSVLFSYKVVSIALNKNITTDFSIVSRKVIDIITNMWEKYSWEMWLSSQAIDKIGNEINYDQKIRFERFFNKESTTQGVVGYSPENSHYESAKSLSLKGIVIVITEESDTVMVPRDSRILALSPSEFISKYEKASELSEKIPLKGNSLEVLIFLSFFKPELFNTICNHKVN